jgi:hypothetical protein
MACCRATSSANTALDAAAEAAAGLVGGLIVDHVKNEPAAYE